MQGFVATKELLFKYSKRQAYRCSNIQKYRYICKGEVMIVDYRAIRNFIKVQKYRYICKDKVNIVNNGTVSKFIKVWSESL